MSDTPGLVDVGIRVVTRISSCRVNTTSRRGIKQLGVSFGSIFLLFSIESNRGHVNSSRRKSPGSCLLMNACLANGQVKCYGKFKLL